MKKATYLISVVIIFLSCKEKDLSELKSESLYVAGLVIEGHEIDSLGIFSMPEDFGGSPVPLAAKATITDEENSSFTLLNQSPGYYSSAGLEMNIAAGKTYHLSVSSDNGSAEASVEIPPPISVEEINGDTERTADTVAADPNSPGLPVFIIKWTELDPSKYAYVLTLENPAGDLTEIPFNVPSGNFKTQYAGTWAQPGVFLYDTDFRYYGTHIFRVYAIDRKYEELFYYGAADLRGLLKAAPDNIDGGKGYFAGASVLEISLTIN